MNNSNEECKNLLEYNTITIRKFEEKTSWSKEELINLMEKAFYAGEEGCQNREGNAKDAIYTMLNN